ncbi:CHRD domain-containing protein [Geomonas sp. RF6]|uniref:CHRD domain-containing protein n=1 Tax=Geomonas sp. RF6 TaxID=2897342 RepID=UPI001E54E6BE|nr:CHRD domain-containing protein [Geomonas sp. RF6]UFS70204.1 CHRD domain-containing protein [Geomonas sp. RF6]
MRKFVLLLVVLFSAVFVGSACYAAEKHFSAMLTGQEETPPVNTKATGKADFKLSNDGKKLSYYISVRDLQNVNAAHIHTGKKGESGPPVANLFSGAAKKGAVNGKFTQGQLTDKDLMGPLQGKTMADLVSLITSGGAFVNVHTDANPNGEIRGQIK